MEINMLLSEDSVVLDLVTKGKRSAMTKIAARMAKQQRIDESTVLARLLARERLHSTGIGHGVAIPHTLLDNISVPAASLTRVAHPIDFGAPDDGPVDLIFTLIWPRHDAGHFLPALASVCRAFRSSALRDMVRGAKSAAETLAIFRTTPHPLSAFGGTQWPVVTRLLPRAMNDTGRRSEMSP